MKLLYNGNMDGDDSNVNNECITANFNLGTGEVTATSSANTNTSSIYSRIVSYLLDTNRRITNTIGLYILTLIPALIVDDLGPVLSITGAVGGSCLAYIGPGLVYLGINGEYFLEYIVTNLLGLPASNNTINKNNNNIEIQSLLNSTPKPWWWYPLLMPIWVHIATVGSNGMNERITSLQLEYQQHDHESSSSSPHEMANEVHTEHQIQHQRYGEDDYKDEDDADDEVTATEIIAPVPRDYFISIFFITFGIIAGIVGVLSNLYVQLF